MPNYDYICEDCDHITIKFLKYKDRDTIQKCEECGGMAERAFVTPPQVRTEKLSRTFVDGHKRKGIEDLKKANQLEIERLKHKPGSEKHRELSTEITERKSIKKRDTYKFLTKARRR